MTGQVAGRKKVNRANKAKNVSGNINDVRVQKSKVVKGGEKKGQGVSEIPVRKKKRTGRSGSIADVEREIEENAVTKGLPSEEKVEKPPQKRKRGADGEIVKAFLLSPKKDFSKLRPRTLVPSFRKIDLNDSDFQRIVGKRVKVYWPQPRRWYAGHIESFDKEKKLHNIFYDDGEKEILDLRKERFELEVMSHEGFHLSSKLGKKKKSSDGGEVSKDMKKRSSLNLGGVEGENNATINKTQVSRAAKKVDLNESDFERIVGKRVKVYWPVPRRWYAGCIKSFDKLKKLHRVCYDDGEEEFLELGRERFELEVMSHEGFHRSSKLGLNLKKKKMSSDGGVVSEEMKKNGPLNVGDIKANNALINENQVSRAAKNGGFQLHEGDITEEKTEDIAINIEVDVCPENIKDQKMGDVVIHVDESKSVNFGDGLGGSDPVKDYAELNIKVALKTSKRASKLRAEKSSKDEKAGNLCTNGELDVLSECVEETANGGCDEKPGVVIGSCNETKCISSEVSKKSKDEQQDNSFTGVTKQDNYEAPEEENQILLKSEEARIEVVEKNGGKENISAGVSTIVLLSDDESDDGGPLNLGTQKMVLNGESNEKSFVSQPSIDDQTGERECFSNVETLKIPIKGEARNK
ncbi:hypothetical protein IFM89_006982 [Coptis chinensis]|uniref:Uncharacterized protein n=1 Tax=Coptis chinensis TaxID=261450 RepID=A0A835HBL7_9MAGN|nr:hypothetical protein IFM89_006982 [Coptis chinensis]